MNSQKLSEQRLLIPDGLVNRNSLGNTLKALLKREGIDRIIEVGLNV